VWQARLARGQLRGELSRRFDELRAGVVELLALVEGALDFAADGVELDRPALEAGRRELLAAIDRLLATARTGQRVREGARVAILGPPNAGKSTLFNRLVGSERAIVAPTPGTTRDVLEAELDIEGVPVVLVDTAGLRDGGDAVEAEGRRRAQAEGERADVVVLLWPADGSRPEAPEGRPVIRVWSKADLGGVAIPGGWTPVAATRSEGVGEVRQAIAGHVTAGLAQLDDPVAVDLRHGDALVRARRHIATAPFDEPELGADDLRAAARAMEELIGGVDSEQVLDAVFRTFCIGK
jgi:tRNA modification GTPase